MGNQDFHFLCYRLVFRGLSGRLYFMEHDSDSEFQVLRHPGPIDIRVAINKFSIPLHFHFLLGRSAQRSKKSVMPFWLKKDRVQKLTYLRFLKFVN